MAAFYYQEGADELVFLDIGATPEGRETMVDIVERCSKQVFIPLTVGGGVRSLADARRLLSSGADKVAVNTGAVENPALIDELASHFGRQAVVVAIDARRQVRDADAESAAETEEPSDRPSSAARWTVVTYGGTRPTSLDAVEWARRVAALGAGEILLTSMDADGTQAGFDCELTATISRAVPIPAIASGGAGTPEHFAEVFLEGAADAALAASVFHFDQYTIRSLKEYLRGRGIAVRL
jgi:cyclase